MFIIMRLFGYEFKRVKEIPTYVNSDIINKVNRALFGLGLGFIPYDNNRPTYLKKGYNTNPDVYAVINQKATEVTRIPYYIKKVKNEQNKERYNQFRLSNKEGLTPQQLIKKITLESKAFEEEKEYPLPLDKPNPTQTWREFFALYETFMDAIGEFYIYLLAPSEGMNAGQPKQIYVLPSHLMEIVLKPDADLISDDTPIDYYVLTQGNSYIRFESENVIHIKKPNPNFDLNGSHLYGMSPLRAALKNIQSSNEALGLNAKTLANGGSFGFISPKAGQHFDPDQAQQIKDRLVQMDNDPKRLSNLAGVSTEMVLTRISLTTDELKPFDYLEYDQKTICNVLGWDDKLLNSDEGAKYDNYKTALRRAITSGVSPNLRLLEEAFNKDLLPRFKGYENTVLIFDESQLPEMQEDMEKLVKWLNDALDRGVISRDEYREAISYDLKNSPEMTMHTVAMNIMPLSDVGLDMSGNDFNLDDETNKE